MGTVRFNIEGYTTMPLDSSPLDHGLNHFFVHLLRIIYCYSLLTIYIHTYLVCHLSLSTDDNIDKILEWYSYFCHKVLAKVPGEDLEQFTDKWGCFPPHLHYNMDQVPLPFVVSQDDTYTTAEDSDIQIARAQPME